MTERFPEYADEIENRMNATVDLAEIFSNRHFYHPKMKMNLRDLPAVFGLELNSYENMIGSDFQAGTAFEYLYRDGDLLQAIEIKASLKTYIKANIESIALVYKGLKNCIDH